MPKKSFRLLAALLTLATAGAAVPGAPPPPPSPTTPPAAPTTPAAHPLTLPSIFGDHMVLQADHPIRVWGTAKPDSEVVARLSTLSASAHANAQGRWTLELPTCPPGGPLTLEISSGGTSKSFQDVLIGEVWLASGQSNMGYAVRESGGAATEIPAANHPRLRFYVVAPNPKAQPQTDAPGSWKICTPETVGAFSAVGYYFAREMQRTLNRPVAILQSAWGGTPAEAWTPREILDGDRLLRPILERFELARVDQAKQMPEFERKLAEWQGKPAGTRGSAPIRPVGDNHQLAPANLFNGMIAPLVPYTLRGAIWYQGESNAGRAFQYRTLFPAMIRSWRERWAQGEYPFYFVQLASFRRHVFGPDKPIDLPQDQILSLDPNERSEWPELREAQALALKVPNTGMATAIDIGEPFDVHPANKVEVGRRLALIALAQVHGRPIVYSGPTFNGQLQIQGDSLALGFTNVAQGLKPRDGQLRGFAVAGEDRVFHWADAKIDGTRILVRSDAVKKPVAARYAWGMNPVANLVNSENLPAPPFRTDDWPMITAGKL